MFIYFEVFIDTWFIGEIILNFFTGYYEKGVMVMDMRKIFRQYMRSWFSLDVISSLPLSYVEILTTADSHEALQSAKILRIFKLTKYARLLRLLRFIKVSKFI